MYCIVGKQDKSFIVYCAGIRLQVRWKSYLYTFLPTFWFLQLKTLPFAVVRYTDYDYHPKTVTFDYVSVRNRYPIYDLVTASSK